MAKLVESFFPVQLSALVDLNTRVFNAEMDARALKEENSKLQAQVRALEELVTELRQECAKRRVERNELREQNELLLGSRDATVEKLRHEKVLGHLALARVETLTRENVELQEAFSEIYESWVATQNELEEALDSLQDMEDERDHALLTIDRMIAGIDEAIERA